MNRTTTLTTDTEKPCPQCGAPMLRSDPGRHVWLVCPRCPIALLADVQPAS